MIDIYRSRRGKNFKCLYWKRKILLNQEELEHKKNVSGVFYATITTSKSKDIQDIANVFRIGVEEIVLQTEDIVNLEPDDKVLFKGDIWLVLRTNDEVIQKNAQYGLCESKSTNIYLRKGK